VDIGAELFAMSAACVRARMLADDGAPEAESAFELAELFCMGARRRVERLFHDLWANDDAANYTLAQRVLAGDFTWAEAGIYDASGEGPMIPRAAAPSTAEADEGEAGAVDERVRLGASG
jgi:hypothetical protein